VADPAGVASAYVRGAAGVAVRPRRIAWIALGLGGAVLSFLVIVLTVSAIDQQSRTSRLHRIGVPVEATVTSCVGRASGTGITTTGYTCRATFTLAGHHHAAVLGGSSALHAPGDIVRAVADPRDPSVLVSTRSVARSTSSWTAFVAPAALFAVLVAAVAIAVWRLRSTTTFAAVLTHRKR
jgi:hypothetical protein